MAEKYFTGSRALFYYNGNLIGYARGISGTEEFTMEPINVLGRLETIDYAPTSYRVNFRCRFFRLVNSPTIDIKGDSSVKSRTGIVPNNIYDIFDYGNVECAIVDRDGKIMMRLINVIPASRSWDVDSRGVWGEDVTFNAIRVIDNQ